MLRLILLLYGCIALWSCGHDIKSENQPDEMSRTLFDYSTLNELGRECYRQIIEENNFNAAQDLLSVEIEKRKTNLEKDSLLLYYIYYFSLPELHNNDTALAERYARECEMYISQAKIISLRWTALYVLNDYYFHHERQDKCFDCSLKISGYSDEPNNKYVATLNKLAKAKAHELNLDYKAALENYLSALYLSKEYSSSEIERFVHYEISNFYKRFNLYDKALEYKINELQLPPRDSNSYYHSRLEQLAYLHKINITGHLDVNQLYEIISFANKNNLKRLKLFAFAFLRTSLVESGKGLECYNIYLTKYPNELADLKTNNIFGYYRLMASKFDSENKSDSASYYYIAALNQMKLTPMDPGYSYWITERFGQFKQKLNQLQEAEELFLTAEEYAKKTNVKEFILNITGKLKALYVHLKNYEKALKYSEIYQNLDQSISSIVHDREMINLELHYSEQIINEQHRKELEHINKIHQNQYNLIAVFIIIVFSILLLGVQMHVPVWFIRALGFLAFILLFEYLIIKLDKTIHYLTHEVPWKLFSLKVILFAFILPFHHWIEKKLVHFLLERRASGKSIFNWNLSSIKSWISSLNSE